MNGWSKVMVKLLRTTYTLDPDLLVQGAVPGHRQVFQTVFHRAVPAEGGAQLLQGPGLLPHSARRILSHLQHY